MTDLKSRLMNYYEKHETKMGLSFFLAGFIFDIFTLSSVDDPLSLLQQVIYLCLAGFLVFKDLMVDLGSGSISGPFQKIWGYRQLALHFILGSLLSLYSLFFLKSASIFSSLIFILVLLILMVANELKRVQQGQLDLKMSLWVICLFLFFAMMVPVGLGFVGIFPFLLSLLITGLTIFGIYKFLSQKVQDTQLLKKKIGLPSGIVLIGFLVFYLLGWVPPVPLSVQNMGIYHHIEKKNNQYYLWHERSWWKFWQSGDQDFVAAPNDKIYFFAEIFSPARFSDSVVLHWYFKDPTHGWQSTDQINMKISGGRQNGYRGFAIKQNYVEGKWRVSVETTDNREIGRLYFEVTKTDVQIEREFQSTIL